MGLAQASEDSPGAGRPAPGPGPPQGWRLEASVPHRGASPWAAGVPSHVAWPPRGVVSLGPTCHVTHCDCHLILRIRNESHCAAHTQREGIGSTLWQECQRIWGRTLNDHSSPLQPQGPTLSPVGEQDSRCGTPPVAVLEPSLLGHPYPSLFALLSKYQTQPGL